MRILAIDTSCDDTSAAIVENGRQILSSVVLSQTETHRLYGGVVPELASRLHTEAICGAVERALTEANTGRSSIDAVAVTCAPGLIGALLVGLGFAKAMAFGLNIPLIPVHHVRAHIAANYLAYPDLEPPFVCLAASGGTTAFIFAKDYTAYRFLGGTRDDAAGEAFDKTARVLGLSYPGGVQIDALAQSGNPSAFRLPHPELADNPLDCSFSGLKTFVVNLVHHAEQTGTPVCRQDLCASFCSTVADMLVPRLIEAARMCKVKTVSAAGGVAANTFLRKRLETACTAAGLRLCLPPLSLCGDNAAMVGAQGYFEVLASNTAGTDCNAYATMEI